MSFHPQSGPSSLASLRRIAGWAALGVLLACNGGTGDRPGGQLFEVSDSAGVAIVRNDPDREIPLERRETMRIGTREGDPAYELFNVRDVVLDAGGDLYAAFQTDAEIRVYDPEGRWLRSMGRQGSGPGEFRFVTWLGVFGDTLLALDPQSFRMTLFSTAGELIDTWSLRAGMTMLWPRSRTADGWIVELDDFTSRVPYDIGQPGTDTARIAVVRSIPDATGRLSAETPPWEVFDVVLKYPRWTTWGIGKRGGPVFGRSALWEARERHAYGPDGSIYVARGSRYAIDVFDGSGRLLRRITRATEPVPITDALVSRYRAAVMSHYDTASTTGEAGLDLVDAAEQHIALPRLDHLPILGAILVAEDGAIWVERPDRVDDPLLLEWSRAGSPSQRWDVFDPEGRYRGTVELPARSTLHVVGTDWMIVTERDDLDVQYIVRYAVDG